MPDRPARRPLALLAVVLAVLAWSAVDPYQIGTWFFETVWVIAGLAVVLAAGSGR
jgi:peptidoglycan/LPS O-acetylase OafA/YrhL